MKKGHWKPRAQVANKVEMDEIIITLPFDILFPPLMSCFFSLLELVI